MSSPVLNVQCPPSSASTRLPGAVPVHCTASARHRQMPQTNHRTVPAAAPSTASKPQTRNFRFRAAGDDPFESLFKSAVFQSEIVRKEFGSVIDDVNTLRALSTKFPDFDLEGKRLYLDKMEDACGRYEIFVKRLELSSDPASKEYLRATNAQMLEAGFSLPLMFSGLKDTMESYRQYVRAEEQAVADPVTHQKFLKELRAAWGSLTLGFMDVSKMDPNNVMRAQKDPQFWKAITEIKQDPERMAAWKDHPNIGPLVQEMWKLHKQQ